MTPAAIARRRLLGLLYKDGAISTPRSVKRAPAASSACFTAESVEALGSETPRSMLLRVANDIPAADASSDCFMPSIARAPRICEGVIIRHFFSAQEQKSLMLQAHQRI